MKMWNQYSIASDSYLLFKENSFRNVSEIIFEKKKAVLIISENEMLWDEKMRVLLLFLIKIVDSIVLACNFYKRNLSDFFWL